MKTVIHRADTRGHVNHGWLNAWHSFSFASYYDPSRMHFGLLRVLNDDTVAPGMGFGMHPHDNMEIVTIPLSGALEHKDTTGGNGVIQKNEVQVMSAGSGLYHSEFNHSKKEEVKLFQLWVFPKEKNVKPRYDQKMFAVSDRINKFHTIIGPENSGTPLWIHQDAYFSLVNIEKEKALDYKIRRKGNGAYVMVIEGAVEIAGEKPGKRDAIGVWETDSFNVKASVDSELLVVEVPMN